MNRFVAFLFLAAACKASVDPNQGRFSCETGEQCGNGYRCIKQFAGGGRCYTVDECQVPESCNGVDDDCDGVIDNFIPQDGRPCESALKGVCLAGKTRCIAGALSCIENVQPGAEVCNGLDDDCDGEVDEDFMLSSNPNNCGVCGRVCAAATACKAGACAEVRCDDGVDNDGNGKIDCADSACVGSVCFSTNYRCVAADAGADAGTDASDAGMQTSDAGPGVNCVAP